VGSAGDFAAGEAVADCLLMSGDCRGNDESEDYLENGFAGEGVSHFLAETRAVGLCHDR